jgi:hypothetical protein
MRDGIILDSKGGIIAPHVGPISSFWLPCGRGTSVSRSQPSSRKGSLKLPEQLIEQVVGLVDQADQNVRTDISRAGLQKLAISLIGVLIFPAQLPHEQRLVRVLVPQRVPASSQVIAIDLQEFLKARAGPIKELQLRLFGGPGDQLALVKPCEHDEP